MKPISSLLFPEPRRTLPYSRWWNIAARTVHIGATGILLGGHVFGVAAETLLPLLWIAMATGALLIAIELYPSAHWAHQLCALSVLLKLSILAVIPWAWTIRVPLLLAVVVIASVGSHAPRKLRHYSVIFKRVMVD